MVNQAVSDMDFKSGEVLLIDKPLHWTSFDVVKKLRYALRKLNKQKKFKVGHAGTLDPLATGLLVLCTGKKTKEIDSFIQEEKEYIADIKFGSTTPSYDLETAVNGTFPTEHLTESFIKNLLPDFQGEQWQTPPDFSAKKVNGKRAFLSARKGIELNLKPNRIDIKSLELLYFQPDEFVVKIKVCCSKGTYIRSFANDLGKAANSGAHLIGLRRTRSGAFSVADAYDIHQLVEQINQLPEKTGT